MKLALVTFALFFNFACIESPLFHHADADSQVSNLGDGGGCAIKLPSEGLCGSLTWIKDAHSVDRRKGEGASFELRFWKEATATEHGPYTSPANGELFVEPLMPSMGHGVYPPVKLNPVKDPQNQDVPGIYRVTDIYFSMPGAWVINVEIHSGSDGSGALLDRFTYPYKI